MIFIEPVGRHLRGIVSHYEVLAICLPFFLEMSKMDITLHYCFEQSPIATSIDSCIPSQISEILVIQKSDVFYLKVVSYGMIEEFWDLSFTMFTSY